MSGLYEASRQATEFDAPRPVNLHIAEAVIDYEHFPEGGLLAYTLFRTLVFRRRHGMMRLIRIFGRVGRALAQLHRYMRLADSTTMTLDFSHTAGLSNEAVCKITQTLDKSPSLAFHGDFGTGNIWIRKCDDKPYIFDAIPSRFCPDSTVSAASIYYDIGHMVSTLWCVYPLWIYPFIDDRPIVECINAFVTGYRDEAECDLDRSMIFATAVFVSDAYAGQMSKDVNSIRRIMRREFLRRRRKALLNEVCL